MQNCSNLPNCPVYYRALEVLPRLRQYGFTDTDSLRDATADFRQTTNPLSVWLERKTSRGDGRIPCKELLFRFNEEVSKENGSSYMTAHAMTKQLRARGIEKRKSDIDYYCSLEWRAD